jgi:L-idonate 5-dehydrogenase
MNRTMQAALLHGPKDLRIEQHPRPELGPGMVRLRSHRAGICGSDLHYYERGYCAGFVPDRPFVLGHELSAEVADVADDVETIKVGQNVTVNPARSCGVCEYCKHGRPNLCGKIVMLGSASSTPPTDGVFAEYVTVRQDQCHVLPTGMDNGIAAMIEPFAVALHAIKRAGTVSGKRVLVTGAGTIGMLVAMTARSFGAVPVAVSDPIAARRERAIDLGADAALDPMGGNLSDKAAELTGSGFDVIFEASGAEPALAVAFDLIRPGGVIVQVGTIGVDSIPIRVNQIMIREIDFIGSMRYGDVFEEAVRLAAAGRVNLRLLISDVFPLSESVQALRRAADKSHSLKVQIEM